MPVMSAAELLALLHQLQLLSPAQRQHLARASDLPDDASALAARLVGKTWLTAYQAEQLLAGHGPDLVLEQHVLLEPLGEGGMGRVFKARHLRLDRLEAIKLLRHEHLDTPEAVERFFREAKAVARLDHPHIVRIHGAGEARGRHFLAMEYVQGIDLASLVDRDGPLPPEQVCLLLYQAALGLQHAHENGLIHRDIKPPNLLLAEPAPTEGPGEKQVLKILDLGLARLQPAPHELRASSLTPSGLVMGTPDYMAPEQARNTRSADIRSDLYALGCTAYHLLAGHPPFVGGGMMEKLLRHQTEPPPPVERVCPEVPSRLAAVIRKLMAKEPAQRYQTPADLAAAVKPLLRTGSRGKSGRKSHPPPPPAASTETIEAPLFRASVVPPPAALPPIVTAPARRPSRSSLSGWLVAAGVAAVVLTAVAVVVHLLR